MRSYAVALAFCLALPSAWCQVAPSSPQFARGPKLPPVVTAVKVVPERDHLDIQLMTSGLASPAVSQLANPTRVVVDLPGFVLRDLNPRIPVNSGSVMAIRSSTFRLAPPIARVVIDLKTPLAYEVQTAPDKVTVRLAVAPVAAARPPAPRAPQPPSAPPPARIAPPVINRAVAPSQAPKLLHDLTVSSTQSGSKITLAFSGPVNPEISRLSNPDRIVLDFADTLPGHVAQRLPVNGSALRSVRVGQYKSDPPVTRVVLDVMDARSDARISAVGNDVEVSLGAGGNSLPAPVVAAGAAPVSSPPLMPAAPPRPQMHNRARDTAAANNIQNVSPAPPPPIPSGPNPPRVTYQNGLLMIVARDSTFQDVLHTVTAVTGTQFEMPPSGFPPAVATERVSTVLGPGAPRDVIAAFLQGSIFDYIIVEPQAGRLKVLLTIKQP